ncbi:MAG: class I SAM-dependent DNA methyltransferase, partial [Proteobacteria bacterium]|nr:class I SAM-dependent DNA methyltransferase [Pseudomonadota bacterium]
FVTGVQTRRQRNQRPINPKATKLLSDLHANLAEQGYAGHKLQLLLVRLLFILFADDTGIWDKDQFLVLLEEKTAANGSDLGRWLSELFGVLDTPEAERQASLDPALAAFPHINGKLFAERIDTAVFDNTTRMLLIDASNFNWGSVSPAIFGSLFEGVIDKVTRRRQGAHYTPEGAILKVIGPLFLDELWTEFERLKARRDGARDRALREFHDKLAGLTFLDPACGAGNFLVVAYRELRDLEAALLKEIYPVGRLPFGVEEISKLNVDQFYGIEIDEFPSQIAQVALWMTDHIANTNLGDIYGKPFARIPLVTAPNIRHADALEIDWADVLPPERCSYVFGNPPFIGAKMQSDAQRAQVRRIAKLGGSGGTLDYVAAWFIKAARYLLLTYPIETTRQSGGDVGLAAWRLGGLAGRASPSSRPIRSRKASRSRSCGRSCFAPAPRSRSPTAPSSGPAARRCIASLSAWPRAATSRRKNACSAMPPTARAIPSRRSMIG